MRIVKNRKPGICVAWGCKKLHTKKDRFCSKHSHKWQKFTNEISYTFQVIKNNARKREIEFTITIEWFQNFCEETGYVEKKGKTPGALTLDRIDNKKGYEPGNVRAISHYENSYKGYCESNEIDCPF